MIQAVVEVRRDIIWMETFRSFTCGVVGCEGPVGTEDLMGLVGDGAGWARRLAWVLARHDGEVGVVVGFVVVDERECSTPRNQIK